MPGTTIFSIKPLFDSPYPLEVVGESRYKSNLLKICGDYDRETGYDDDTHAAELILEDGNIYDHGNAVLVQIDDLPVGYLAKDNASIYRRHLAQLGFTGDVVGICTASIKGGFEKDGEIVDFGVRLAFSPGTFEPENKKPVASITQPSKYSNSIPIVAGRPKKDGDALTTLVEAWRLNTLNKIAISLAVLAVLTIIIVLAIIPSP